MGTIQTMLGRLGADSSFVIQFLLIATFFFILRFIFIDKLHFVIEDRIEKTINQEKSADLEAKKAHEFGEKYKQRLNGLFERIQKSGSEQKAKIIEKEKSKLQALEVEISRDVEDKMANLNSDYLLRKNEINKHKSEFLKLIVDKVS